MINLKILKDWCDVEINAVAWQRIGLELFDELSSAGLDYDQIESPSNTEEISVEIFELINNKVIEIYEISIEREMVEA